MLAGIAAYVKRVRPGVLVIGVEAEDAAGMTASIKAGKLTTLDQVGIFAVDEIRRLYKWITANKPEASGPQRVRQTGKSKNGNTKKIREI